ncbi:MAG: HD domain-containing phosphohydrolase [Dehalococcoidia bacterium]
MGRESNITTYLRFAVISFIVMTVAASAFAFVSAGQIRSAQEKAAATSTAFVAGNPLRAQLAAGAPIEAIEDQAGRLLSENVRQLRIWTDQGGVIYASPALAERDRAPVPSSNVTWTRARAADGTSLFVTRIPANGYMIEVAQTAASVDSGITSAQRTLIVTAAAFMFIAYAALQGAYWIGIRRFAFGYRRLLHMYQTGQQIRSSLDLQEVMTQLSHDATELAHGHYGLIALYEEETGELMLKATYDRSTGTIAHHQRAVEEWFLRRCVATRTTIVTEQPAAPYQRLFGPEMTIEGQMQLLCVPMPLRDKVVGAIVVVRRSTQRGGGFIPDEVRQVEELAAQAVMAVEQAQLFAKVRSYATELEMSYDTTLKVLMAALDTKDEVTEGHCERVAKLTVQLAKAMDVPEPMLVNMERGALLHDVGKIGVPDEVLKKPKALNDGEWEAMRKHPLLAGLMVSKVGFLEGALPILLYHHERYDGTGYPFGLSGEKIPIEARIFAVVDSYDAMTSDRPYRSAMSHEDAMEEVRRYSGIQFDPSAVLAFDGLMEERPDLREHGGHRITAEHDEHEHELPPLEPENTLDAA